MQTSPTWMKLKERGIDSAEKLIEQFGFLEPSIDMTAIADEVGAPVFLLPDTEEYRKLDGILVLKDGDARIFVNRHQSITRQRFTAAHELGHLFLHSSGDDRVSYRSHDWRIAVPYDAREEREANAFAADLLMPENMVRARVHLGDVHYLASWFKVSPKAMSIRVNSLLVDPAYY